MQIMNICQKVFEYLEIFIHDEWKFSKAAKWKHCQTDQMHNKNKIIFDDKNFYPKMDCITINDVYEFNQQSNAS